MASPPFAVGIFFAEIIKIANPCRILTDIYYKEYSHGGGESLIRGLYTAATGMIAEQTRQDTVANNLANVNTVGFKRDNVTETSFHELLLNAYSKKGATPIGALGLGVDVDGSYTDYSTGNIVPTDNPTDLAITGDALLAVERNGQVRYTRAGNLTLNQDRTLVTQNGDPVLGQNGPIQLAGSFTVAPDGAIIQNGQEVDRLRLSSTAGMVKQDDFYVSGNAAPAAAGADTRIIQGALEGSNVNPIREMINMITVTRSYDANQKVLLAQDDTLGKAVNDLAK